jgi:hypothetical protein
LHTVHTHFYKLEVFFFFFNLQINKTPKLTKNIRK